MADTLTIDPTPTAEVMGTPEGVELTADEQESLAVGEKMVEQQEQLLAGKYKDAEALEKAYIELQTKLGDDGKAENKTEAEKEEVLPEESEESSEESSPAVALITEASEEYYANDGTLKPETIEKFSSMSSQDLVNAYMEVTKNNPQQEPAATVAEPTQADINTIQNSVGGEAEYGKLIQWAGSNLDKTSVEAFDDVVATGSVPMIKLAVRGLQAQYENDNGYEGRMLTGKAAKTGGDVFRSQAELVAAMGDSRYENDPAYRQDIIEKLDRSDLQF